MSLVDAQETAVKLALHWLILMLWLTNEDQHHTGRSIMFHLPDPVGNGLKRGATRDVVGHHGPVGAAVVALSDGAESLLPRCVPHLHLQQVPAQGCGSSTSIR